MINQEKILLEFLKGNSTNYDHKTISDIWSYDMDQLENDHHYIQWIFPLTTRSKYNILCPTIKDIGLFMDERVVKNIRKSFSLMLYFYGLEYKNNKVYRSKDYEERLSKWCTKNNHNYKRITRILLSLKLFRLTDEANAFYLELTEIYKQNPNMISEKKFNYWTSAIE